MRRRDVLIAGAAAMAAGWRSAHAAALPRLALLGLGGEIGYYAPFYAAFLKGLAELGYVEGQDFALARYYADGDTGKLPALAREMVPTAPALILADTPSATFAAHAATNQIPIICPLISDTFLPVLVASYAHPGGNVTGLAATVGGMIAKLIDLTMEALPGITTLGVLVNPSSVDQTFLQKEVVAAGNDRGVAVIVAGATTQEELRPAFQRLVESGARAIVVPPNALLQKAQNDLAAMALVARVPLVFDGILPPAIGGLLSYGNDVVENYRRAAGYAAKILKGANPGDLPVEFPAKFIFAVNLKTAHAMGISIPPTLLARADQVIE